MKLSILFTSFTFMINVFIFVYYNAGKHTGILQRDLKKPRHILSGRD